LIAVDVRVRSAKETSDIAMRLGAHLVPGDALLLEGPLGAGKTHFARSLIQSRLDRPEDVPSPTFTLIQTYDAGGVEIWHADLYRLGGAGDVYELGLEDAFETAICLIEWPDRLQELTPSGALTLRMSLLPDAEGRLLSFVFADSKWHAKLADV